MGRGKNVNLNKNYEQDKGEQDRFFLKKQLFVVSVLLLEVVLHWEVSTLSISRHYMQMFYFFPKKPEKFSLDL